MTDYNYPSYRRFTLVASTPTRLIFSAKQSHGVDIANLSTTDTVYVMEDSQANTNDNASIKLMPGMTYSITQEFTILYFYSTGTPEVQIIKR